MAPNICWGDLQEERLGMHVGVVVLAELDPAGGAGGDQGQRAAVLDAVDKLGALLHDGQVGGDVGVEHLVKAQAAQGGDHLALHVGADGHAEALAQGGADGGGGAARPRAWSGSARAAQTLSVSSFSVRAPVGQTAMHWPQVTQADFAQVHVKGAADVGGEAAVVGADDAARPDFAADGDAAAAEDALGVVADQMGGGVVDARARGLAPSKRHSSVDAVVAGTASAARSWRCGRRTGTPCRWLESSSSRFVLRESQHLGGVGLDLHALGDAGTTQAGDQARGRP